jgi:hypothetical protein
MNLVRRITEKAAVRRVWSRPGNISVVTVNVLTVSELEAILSDLSRWVTQRRLQTSTQQRLNLSQNINRTMNMELINDT